MSNLSETTKVSHKVQVSECKKVCLGFGYFVSEYCWIEDKRLSRAIRFLLWVSQVAILSKFLASERLIILKARQLGLTWLTAAYCLWLAITKPLQLIVVISAKEDWAVEFLDRVKFIQDRLPVWLVPTVLKRTGQEMIFDHFGLNSAIKSLATTPEGAQSKTPTLLVLDESALNRYIKEIWAGSKPGIDAAGGRIIIISNAIKDGPGWSWTRNTYSNAMAGLNDFQRIFMPWNSHPDRPPDFIERQKAEGMDDDDISKHYPSSEDEAISAMLGSYFGRTLARFKPYQGERGRLELLESGKPRFVPDNEGILEVWAHPQAYWTDRYAVGSDISEGLGDTYSVAYVYDRLDKCYVARLRSNRIAADVWAMRLIDLAEYYNHAKLGPESNGAGITTIYTLRGKYDNLYCVRKPGRIRGEIALRFGWLETAETKQVLADDLKRHYREVFSEVPCAILIDESSTFIRHQGGDKSYGTLSHESGKLDDCVIAAGIALQVSIAMPLMAGTEQVEAERTRDAEHRKSLGRADLQALLEWESIVKQIEERQEIEMGGW